MLRADEVTKNQTIVNGKWVAAKPAKQPFLRRLHDAIQVLLGNAEAVTFEGQD